MAREAEERSDLAERTGRAMFARTERMLGPDVFDALARTRVALFGAGGVGSWCAEALVRSGVRRLMLVDYDRVCVTNINRQSMATTRTIGQVKIDVLAGRLKEINPAVELDLRRTVYDASSAAEFDLSAWDYVIDAIDSVESKALLIRQALAAKETTLFSAMGAALKMDPFQIRKSDFTRVFGDGLARALRQKFRKTGGIPRRRFTCIWSPERRENFESVDVAALEETCAGPLRKARPNGTLAHTTAIVGFALAGLVVADVERRVREGV